MADQISGDAEFLADARQWFWRGPIEPGIALIAEPGHVFSWLIAGAERSLLLDTGLGIADIREPVAALGADQPLVVNSHAHFDHVGGNARFDEVAMHESAPDWLQSGTDPELLDAYAGAMPELSAAWRALLELDRECAFLAGPEAVPRPWPQAAIAERGWLIEPPAPTRTLRDGDVLDLGDRRLRVIHTPGHAAEHICLLDERAGILWAQDQVYYGPLLIFERGSSIEAFACSPRRLADELAGAVRTVYTAHCLRYSVPPQFLGEVAAAAEAVAAGEAEMAPAPALFGPGVRAADYGHFSILVPA
mgnify:CR=1 FL=1